LITCPRCGAQLSDHAAACAECGGPVPLAPCVPPETVVCIHCSAQVNGMAIVCPRCDEPPVWRVIPGINDRGRGTAVRAAQSAKARKRPWGSITTPLFYHHHKPTRLGKLVNRSWARVYSLGLVPDFLVTLEVKGRLRHRMHSTALVVAECNGEKYVVSMLGDSTAWVRNVQATGGEAIVRHGRSQDVRLVAVPPDQRAPVLKAYLQRAVVARPHFPVAWNAPLDAFETVAASYPVFRIMSR